MSALGLWEIEPAPNGLRVQMVAQLAYLLRVLLTERPDYTHPLDSGDRTRVIVSDTDPLSRWEADDANARMLTAQTKMATAARGTVLATLGSTDGLADFDTVLDGDETDAWMSTLNRLHLRLRGQVDDDQVGAGQPMFRPDEPPAVTPETLPGVVVGAFLEDLAAAQLS